MVSKHYSHYLALVIMLTALFSLNSAQSQTTYTVTTTSATGSGSFLEAVNLANNNPGADIIEFTPGLQVDATTELPTLQDSRLVNITESVVIDGKGGAVLARQQWVDFSGNLNNDLGCPQDLGWLILAEAKNFLEVGVFGADNTGIDVTVQNLSIREFNSVALVNDNASLTFDNFTANDTWNTIGCAAEGLIGAGAGASLTLKNSKFDGLETWTFAAGGSAIVGFGVGDLTIENCEFKNFSKREQFAIFWGGAPGSKVNIVSSIFSAAGGIWITDDVSETNIVNSIWVNNWDKGPKYGDRILNDASGDMNIIASSLRWNTNECQDVSGVTLCDAFGIDDLILRSGSGRINFIQSAVGFNFPDQPSIDYFNTIGDDGGGTNGITADEYTWIQATAFQGEAVLKTITNQPSLLTNTPGFVEPYLCFGLCEDYEVAFVKPAFPGELIDVIPTGIPLINPIDGTPIILDVAGNPRVDANGERDIGAVQLGLAPILTVDGIGDGSVDLSWNEPLHHNGLSIISYEIEYSETSNPGSTTITIDPPVLSQTVSGLTNGTEYNFEVRAIYSGPENGPYSNTVTATPLGAIGTPVVTAVPGDTEVDLSWTLPDLGGRGFESFTILYRVDGTTDFTGALARFLPTETSITVPGLTNGTTYEFAVAVNASGDVGPQGTVTATPQSSLSSDDFTTKNISVYPNPVKDYLNIDFNESFSVKLFSVTGSLLIETESNGRIDMSGLREGLYILQIDVNGKKYFTKILKK